MFIYVAIGDVYIYLGTSSLPGSESGGRDAATFGIFNLCAITAIYNIDHQSNDIIIMTYCTVSIVLLDSVPSLLLLQPSHFH